MQLKAGFPRYSVRTQVQTLSKNKYPRFNNILNILKLITFIIMFRSHVNYNVKIDVFWCTDLPYFTTTEVPKTLHQCPYVTSRHLIILPTHSVVLYIQFYNPEPRFCNNLIARYLAFFLFMPQISEITWVLPPFDIFCLI